MWLERAAEPATLLDPAVDAPSMVGVANIDYDAKGQRQRIDYKNGASTYYDYDPLTFRLTHLYTRRGTAFTEDCDNPQPPPPITAAPDTPPGARPAAAEPALHLRPCRQHHPHPGRRAADHLLPQPARRAEQRLHLRCPLPADPGHRPRTPRAEAQRRSKSADRARCPQCVPCPARPSEHAQSHGHVHRALRVRRRRQLPADAAPRQRPCACGLDARI